MGTFSQQAKVVKFSNSNQVLMIERWRDDQARPDEYISHSVYIPKFSVM